MIKLYDNETGAVLGELTDEQLDFLIDNLEEESEKDTDYYINPTTLEMLEQNGADKELLQILRNGMGDRKEFEIRWDEE
jgi:hypothetical protein